MKQVNWRQSGQILWIAMIILSGAPVHAYTTPSMHAPEFDGGWGLLDPSTWLDPNELERQTALTGGWGGALTGYLQIGMPRHVEMAKTLLAQASAEERT